MKTITIGVPCYKAESTLRRLLSSINTQTYKDAITVLLSVDNLEEDYSYIIKDYPELCIIQINNENGGPGQARQKALDKCDTEFITFMDADDMLADPFTIESLMKGFESNDIVEIFAPFLQVGSLNENNERMNRLENNPGHPWVFGRVYRVKFLRENNIRFPEKLRAMEDGCFNWKIRMLTEGTQWRVGFIQQMVAYCWMPGSEHSITRIGEKNGIPQYNFDLCQIGAVIAAEEAIKFVKEKNPFNTNILQFATEQFVSLFFTYVTCLGRRPEFAKQNMYIARYFYHKIFKDYSALITDKQLEELYTVLLTQKSQEMIGIIPEITFHKWLTMVRDYDFDVNEIIQIRQELPEEIIQNDLKCGVLDESCSLFIK